MTSIIGNEAAQATFLASARSGSMPHAWLFAGPAGVGKASFAREAAIRMLVNAADPSVPIDGGAPLPDHPIASQIAAGSHPDFRVLRRLPKDPEKPDQNVARSIPIAQIRALQPMFATRPSHSSRRVVIIDAIDDCERSAANALLKNLEEPPAGTIFVLISHAPGRLLPTIRSRCRLLRFDPVADEAIATILRRALPDASAGEIDALVRAGQGSPGRALAFAGLDLAVLEREMEALAQGGDPTNAIRAKLGTTLGAKSAQPRYEAFLERAPSFIAERARGRSGQRLREALDAYAAARDLSAAATRLSLDANATAFEMGGLIARLADMPARAH
ncbi:AAA family ATPase [Stakelama marina]|uniref:DNA polymerase III subunit delta n=1 Tax=Stakelama marina TaxID=2826939 RepID=A0A8T4IH91_9SPHN|nr:AAA family ATPase [Stakelama marina]MBR0551586.1 DNA polymerase III subunit delta' [Stakelama marina]